MCLGRRERLWPKTLALERLAARCLQLVDSSHKQVASCNLQLPAQHIAHLHRRLLQLQLQLQHPHPHPHQHQVSSARQERCMIYGNYEKQHQFAEAAVEEKWWWQWWWWQDGGDGWQVQASKFQQLIAANSNCNCKALKCGQDQGMLLVIIEDQRSPVVLLFRSVVASSGMPLS